jgi:hypothetical protein
MKIEPGHDPSSCGHIEVDFWDLTCGSTARRRTINDKDCSGFSADYCGLCAWGLPLQRRPQPQAVLEAAVAASRQYPPDHWAALRSAAAVVFRGVRAAAGVAGSSLAPAPSPLVQILVFCLAASAVAVRALPVAAVASAGAANNRIHGPARFRAGRDLAFSFSVPPRPGRAG